jgi:hypothetical protein
MSTKVVYRNRPCVFDDIVNNLICGDTFVAGEYMVEKLNYIEAILKKNKRKYMIYGEKATFKIIF